MKKKIIYIIIGLIILVVFLVSCMPPKLEVTTNVKPGSYSLDTGNFPIYVVVDPKHNNVCYYILGGSNSPAISCLPLEK